MLKLYDKTFSTLYGTLSTVTEAFVEEERNGLFELSFIILNTDSLFKYIDKENIVVCNANDTLLNQKFRIYDTRKLMNNRVQVFARHISFDLMYDYIENLSFENQSCEYALNQLFRLSNFSQHYRGYSDIVNAQDYSISNSNILNAIGGTKGSIIDTFGNGPELLRDNENIHVLSKRGNDNSVTIEYRKNLTGFELEEDTTDLETRCGGYVKYTDSETSEEMVLTAWVDSPLINNYAHPYIRPDGPRDYSDKFEEGHIPTVEELKVFIEKEFSINKRDIVKENYKIEFIPLSKCVGYEGLSDKISLCDTVTIKDTRYNINTQAKVIKTVFNVLKNRYESIELGEPKTSLGDIISSSSNDKVTEEQVKDIVNSTPSTNYPNTLPSVPTLEYFVYGFANIELRWTFENKVFYAYEVYASKTKDFTPNIFDLIYQGQASSYMFQAQPNETWYFKVCGVNSYNRRTQFSNQVEVVTTKISDLSNYVDKMAIGDALIGELNLGRGWIGKLNANLLDVKGNFSVTDGNGKRTLDIDSFGNVNMDLTSLKIQSKSIDDVIDNKANTVFDSKTQADIFNKLTNNAQVQGIYLQDGKIYLNGQFMQVESLKVGDFTNLAILESNSTFTGSSGGNVNGYEVCSITGSEKYNHTILTQKIYNANAGDNYRVRCKAKSKTSDSANLCVTLCWRDNAGALLSTVTTTVIANNNSFTDMNNIITIPTKPLNGAYINFKIHIQDGTYRRVYVEGLEIRRMADADLIVDGAITADKLQANAIDGKTITGSTIVGGAIRGSSNFFTAPDANATEGYGFRIYSTGAMYTNNNIQIEGGSHHVYLGKDGIVDCSNRVVSPLITTGNSALWLGIKGAAQDFSQYNIVFRQESDSYVYLRPGNNSTIRLGHSSAMFNIAYIKNGVSSSSDRTLKENIQYLATTENARTTKSADLTELDLYNFVRDDLVTATYNFIGDEKTHIGFIAQDLLYNIDGSDNKVGQLIVNKPDNEQSPLTYNEKIYTNVLAGALRQAILKIEELEKKINILEELLI